MDILSSNTNTRDTLTEECPMSSNESFGADTQINESPLPCSDFMNTSRSLSLGPYLSMNLNQCRLNSRLSLNSDQNGLPNLQSVGTSGYNMDDFMLGTFPGDDLSMFQTCFSQVMPDLSLLRHSMSRNSCDENGMMRISSLPFEDFTFQFSPLGGMEEEDVTANNLLNSRPLNLCISSPCCDLKETLQKADVPTSSNSSRHFSFALSLPSLDNPNDGMGGPLPRGSIRNMSIQIGQNNESSITDINRDYPLPNEKSNFSLFDEQYGGISGETLADGSNPSESNSVFSDENDINIKPSSHKKQARNKKKWKCTSCHYINNYKTKACLNCGFPSPIQASFLSSYHYDSSSCYTSSQQTTSTEPSLIRPIDLADPTDPIDTSVAIRMIGKDIEVGGGWTMKEFPFAYIPPNPFGDNSIAALKLLVLRSRKTEPRICAHCGITVTPKWRRSPPPMRFLLCNACGLQYNKSADDNSTHSISPLEECQGGYCVCARASGNYIKRRLFNRHILSMVNNINTVSLIIRLRLCYYCNRLRRQNTDSNDITESIAAR